MVHEGLTLTALAFVLGIACLFLALLAFETAADATQPRLKLFGLFTWLISGNWPAKVGAGLVIIGVGALIRYFLLSVGVSADIKLGSGVAAAAALGAASFALRDKPNRRALHLALAGAALGVAYLTAYSAYGFFGYVTSTTALALLVLVAAATAGFAVRSNALSVAVLGMLGAFVSPAFTLGQPGPTVIYGYYLGVSLFTFVLVYLRGWRALIHLSFLFTLGGSVFFAWTHQFYTPRYFNTMQPLLLALVAIHIAMPLAERRAVAHGWLRRFDVGYAVALPLVAVVLMMLISPDRTTGAWGVLMLAGLWAGAAGVIRLARLEGALGHVLVALLLACAAAVLYVEDVPWSLVGLLASTGLLIVAPRLGLDEMVEMLLTGAVLLLAALHIQNALLQPAVGVPFLNQPYALRFVGVVALLTAAAIARRRDLPLGTVLSVVSWVWAGLVLATETARLELEILPQLAHAAVTAAIFAVALSPLRQRLSLAWMGSLVVLSIGTAWWGAFDASREATWALVFAAPLSLALMAFSAGRKADADDPVAPVFALVIPLVLAPWALQLGSLAGLHTPFFAMTLVALAVLAVTYGGKASGWRAPVWASGVVLYFWAIALVMGGLLLAYIDRGVWPVAFDLVAVAALALLASAAAGNIRNAAGGMTVAIAAFVLQAMLLRWFGPPGILTVADLARMDLPAVVSFMWATFGGAMCWWSSRIASRGLWVLGATLLALSAIKLVLFDFGSLGELANIVALLLAGVVFLAVAWLAPIPPKREEEMVAGRTVSSGRPGTGSTGGAAGTPEYTQGRPYVPGNGALDTASDGETRSRWTLLLILVSLTLIAIVLNKTANGGRASTPARAEPVEAMAPEEPLAAPSVPSAPVPPLPQMVDATVVDTPGAEPPAAAVERPRLVDACTQFLDRLPSDFVLVAGGAYQGRGLAFQIDQSGHEATGFDVVVDMPGRPVVLALGAYEPSVWRIRRSANTRIAGVFLTGYHRQAAFGITTTTPLLNSTYEEKGPCGYSYLSSGNPDSMDTHLQRVFGRQAESYSLASNGQLLIGSGGMPATAIQDMWGSYESFRDSAAPLAGAAGLEDLVARGMLRRATANDLTEWKAAHRNGGSAAYRTSTEATASSLPFKTYVVQRDMTFPSGLYGANAATFIVPTGVAMPRGNPGHSAVYDWNTLRCNGPLCGVAR